MSAKIVLESEKQKRFFSSSFSSFRTYWISDESVNLKVNEKGKQFLIIIGGIKLISIASSFIFDTMISDLVFFKNVNFDVPFDKYELYSIPNFSFRILTWIKFDQFLNLKSGFLMSDICFKAIPSLENNYSSSNLYLMFFLLFWFSPKEDSFFFNSEIISLSIILIYIDVSSNLLESGILSPDSKYFKSLILPCD